MHPNSLFRTPPQLDSLSHPHFPTTHSMEPLEYRYKLPDKVNSGIILGKNQTRLRAVENISGCSLQWDPETREILITYKSLEEMNSCLAELRKIINDQVRNPSKPAKVYIAVPDNTTQIRFEEIHERYSSVHDNFVITQPVVDRGTYSSTIKSNMFRSYSEAMSDVESMYQRYKENAEENEETKITRMRFSLGYSGMRTLKYRAGQVENIDSVNKGKKSGSAHFVNNLENRIMKTLKRILPSMGYVPMTDIDDREISMHFIDHVTKEYLDVRRKGKEDSRGDVQWKNLDPVAYANKKKFCLITFMLDPKIPHIRFRYDQSDKKKLNSEQEEYASKFHWDENHLSHVTDEFSEIAHMKLDCIRFKELSEFKNSAKGITFECSAVHEKNCLKTEVVVKYDMGKLHPREVLEEIKRILEAVHRAEE